MTKQHFQAMAAIVKAILDGKWTNEQPIWAADGEFGDLLHATTNANRAIQTAEAFIILCEQYNPRFDRQRFLIACGLVEAPIKVRKSRKQKFCNDCCETYPCRGVLQGTHAFKGIS